MEKKQKNPKIAVVCASNNNRSMAAHFQCEKAKIEVKSYGTGQQVKLPGKTQTEQNVYDFGTPYSKMIEDLKEADEKYYTKTGLIQMLERNAGIKLAPEKFQHAGEHFDVVVTYEMRVFEQALSHFTRSQSFIEGGMAKPTYVINLCVFDNAKEAHLASIVTIDFLKEVLNCKSWRDDFEGIVKKFSKMTENKYKIMYSILFV